MKCPCCCAADLIHDTRDMPYTHEGKTTVIPAVTGDYCPACGESLLNREESERCMAAMRALHDASAPRACAPGED